jgi:hypothetical protein
MKIANMLKDAIGQVKYNLQNGLLIILSNILNINHSGLRLFEFNTYAISNLKNYIE